MSKIKDDWIESMDVNTPSPMRDGCDAPEKEFDYDLHNHIEELMWQERYENESKECSYGDKR